VLSGRDKCVLSSSTNTGGSTPTSTTTGWSWPLPNSTHIGSGGYYLATGSKGYHPGIDIGASGGGSLGAAVKAAHSGYVTQSYNGGSCGWFMVVKATNTQYWMGYQHLDPNKSHLGAGTAVSAGQTIGYVGPAGGSSCGSAGFYHVHFSLELQNGLTFWNTSKSYVESRTDSPCSVLPGC
jgi:murein DD-endopeptidase MepM/ murein hydrolase activator NlpD